IDADKVVAWLRRKCERSGDLLPPAVASLLAGGAVGGQAAGTGAREMALLVSEYLSEYWATRLLAEYGGSVDNGGGGEKTVVFDAPESYVQGVASTKTPVKQQQQQQQQEKPKTAKEKQLEKAAKKSKSITSFFQKKAAAP
ncbi:hypothetical protein GGI11_006047, partial [Coemansia sp. RSA 2049]